MDRGPVFTQLRLVYSLPGTVHADVILKFYAQVPQVDFQLELGKTISTDIESVFLPLSLQLPDSRLYLRKGRRPSGPVWIRYPAPAWNTCPTRDWPTCPPAAGR